MFDRHVSKKTFDSNKNSNRQKICLRTAYNKNNIKKERLRGPEV